MPTTPPTPFPIIGEGTTVRFKLGALLGMLAVIVAAAVGGAVWATKMDNATDRLQGSVERIDHRIERIEDALGLRPFADTMPRRSPGPTAAPAGTGNP